METRRFSRLPRAPPHTALRWFSRASGLRLILPNGQAREDRHDDQPAVRELIIAHDRVAVVALLARPAEATKDVARLGSRPACLTRGRAATGIVRATADARDIDHLGRQEPFVMQRRLTPNCGRCRGGPYLVRLGGTGYSVNPVQRPQRDALSTI